MALFLAVAPMQALRLEKINFGDFSNWVTRDIKESAVLGGKVKTVYAIGPAKHIRGNVPTQDFYNLRNNIYIPFSLKFIVILRFILEVL